MLMISLILEDLKLHAVASCDGKWAMSVVDTHAKIGWEAEVTIAQMSAIAAIAIGIGEEEDTSPELTAALYAIARPSLKDCPKECYPIP